MVICLRARRKKNLSLDVRLAISDPFVFFSKLRSFFEKKTTWSYLVGAGAEFGGFWVGFWGFLGFQSPMPPKYPFNPKKGHQRHLEDQFLPKGVMTRLTFTLPGRGPRFFWMGGMIFWNLPPGFLGWCFVLTWRMGSLETADGEIGWFQMLTDPSGECYTMKKVTVDIRVVWFCSEVGGGLGIYRMPNRNFSKTIWT